jgi:predicted component of type VI protein secretion system
VQPLAHGAARDRLNESCDILEKMTTKLSKAGNEPPHATPQGSLPLAELEVDRIGKFPVGRVTTIGRVPESNIVLNTRSVSRQHARIFFEGNHFWIKDLESANGTRVNGKKITLQMLSDGDKLCLGEVHSVFHTSAHVSGPAAVAKDPLAGIDDFFSDGTPTGGLKSQHPQPCIAAEEHAPPDQLTDPASREIEQLRKVIDTLEGENAQLRNEIRSFREGIGSAGSTGSTQSLQSGDLQVENERLRRLVNQLERALADSNLRLRNLQERIK